MALSPAEKQKAYRERQAKLARARKDLGPNPSYKQPSPEQLVAQRELREARVKAAEAAGVAIGWVGPDLSIPSEASHPDPEFRQRLGGHR